MHCVPCGRSVQGFGIPDMTDRAKITAQPYKTINQHKFQSSNLVSASKDPTDDRRSFVGMRVASLTVAGHAARDGSLAVALGTGGRDHPMPHEDDTMRESIEFERVQRPCSCCCQRVSYRPRCGSVVFCILVMMSPLLICLSLEGLATNLHQQRGAGAISRRTSAMKAIPRGPIRCATTLR